MNLNAGTWELVWAHVHRVLVLNLGFAVTNLPLLAALAVVHDPWHYPAFFGALALGVGPSLAAAFGYLAGESFPRAYRRHFAPALLAWAALLGLVAVLAVDAVAVPALVPLFVVTAVVAAAVVVRLLGLLPSLRGRPLVSAACRRLPSSLFNVAVLGVAAVLVNQAPLLALAVVPGCALVVAASVN